MARKKIAVDARMINMSGIGVYLQHHVEAGLYSVALGRAEEIKEYSSSVNVIDYDAKIYGIGEQLKFPYSQLRKEKVDILHVPHYNIPIFYFGTMYVTIHDLTHLILPEILPNKFAYIYAWVMLWLAAHKAKKIFTVSENTKNDIIKFFKINPEKIIVTYNGVDVSSFKKKDAVEYDYLYEKFGIPRNKKVLIYVGNLKPHKNLSRLLEAFKNIEQRENAVLLLVGKAFNNHNLSGAEEKNGVAKQVIHTGMVTNEELVDLYNLADLFVFPSLYEGFGIPPLEAMACGTPVVCSNNSSLPEVVDDAALMIDPLKVEEITKAIDIMLSDQQLREDYIAKGYKRCNVFGWDRVIDLFSKNL